MPSVPQIASWIVESFNGQQTANLERSIETVLRNRGFSDFDAAEQAEEKSKKVLAHLQTLRQDTLPFDFSSSNEFRLLGKQRLRHTDSSETTFIRQNLNLALYST